MMNKPYTNIRKASLPDLLFMDDDPATFITLTWPNCAGLFQNELKPQFASKTPYYAF